MVTQLTKNAIDSLINSNDPSEIYVIQIIQAPSVVAENLFKVQISDGFSKFKKSYFVSDAAIKCQELKELSIIKCRKYIDESNQDKERIIISSYDLVCQNVTELIGKPIDYKNYKYAGLSNPEGSVIIPQKYLSRNMQVSQQNQGYIPKQIIPPQSGSMNTSANLAQQKPSNNYNQAQNNGQQNQKSMTQSAPLGNISNNNKSIPLDHSNENDEKDLDTICLLTPNNPCSFKARVTKKSPMRSFENAKNKGQIFSIDVIDANGDETTVSFFNEQALKFEGQFAVSQVLIFKNVGVKPNTNTTYNKGENIVSVNKDSIILIAHDDGSIQMNKMKKKTLADVEIMNKNENIDLICLVKEDSQIKQIQLKSGENKTRRDIIVFDESQVEIEVSLWGDKATSLEAKKGDVIVFKDAKIGEFRDKKQINVGYATQVFINPEISQFPQARALLSWYESLDSTQLLSSLQKVGGNSDFVPATAGSSKQLEYSLQHLKEEISRSQNQLDENFKIWKEVRAQVIFIKDSPLYYNACPKCKKKVQKEEGSWACHNACSMQLADGPESRYIASLIIGDATETMWVNAYDEVGKKLFNMDANIFRQVDEDIEQGGVDTKKKLIMQAQNKEHRFLLLTKAEKDQNGMYKDKTIIHSIKDIQPAEESKKILNSLNKYLEIANKH